MTANFAVGCFYGEFLWEPKFVVRWLKNMSKLYRVFHCTDRDTEWLIHTANLADSSAGQTHPHPNAACTIVDSLGKALSEAFLWAQVGAHHVFWNATHPTVATPLRAPSCLAAVAKTA